MAGELLDPVESVGDGADAEVESACRSGGDPAGCEERRERVHERLGALSRLFQRSQDGGDQVGDGGPVAEQDLEDEQVGHVEQARGETQ